jgi:ABC-type oligopeptide transport system ATPase subunit
MSGQHSATGREIAAESIIVAAKTTLKNKGSTEWVNSLLKLPRALGEDAADLSAYPDTIDESGRLATVQEIITGNVEAPGVPKGEDGRAIMVREILERMGIKAEIFGRYPHKIRLKSVEGEITRQTKI